MRRSHLALGMASLAVALATAPMATPVVAADDWTVLTMAPDGSWGTATNSSINEAIATAIVNCKIVYQREIGCGAASTTIRAGWSLGIRCGRENIVVAERTLADAEQAARNREAELRWRYVRDMPSCRRLVTVDSSGAIVARDPEGRETARDQSLPRRAAANHGWSTLPHAATTSPQGLQDRSAGVP